MLATDVGHHIPGETDGLSGANALIYAACKSLKTSPCRSFDTGALLAGDFLAHRSIVVLSRGVVGRQHLLNDGRRSISTIFIAGDVFDFRHTISGAGALICLSPVKVNLLKAEEFDNLLQKDGEFRALLKANHLRHDAFTSRHCADVARKSSLEKLASFIFECQDRLKVDADGTIDLLLKRIDIVDYMGLRPETLSRAFARLRELQLITCDDNDRVHILNEQTLRHIANGENISTLCDA